MKHGLSLIKLWVICFIAARYAGRVARYAGRGARCAGRIAR